MIDERALTWAKLANWDLPEPPVQYTNNEDARFEYNNYWYVATEKGYYLQSDGVIRENAGPHQTDAGYDTHGWFKTKKDAELAIKLFYERLDFEYESSV
jgi:hypothetical protein